MADYVIQIAPAAGVSKDALLMALSSKRNPGDAGFNLPGLRDIEHHLIVGGEISHKILLGMRIRVRKRQKDNTFTDWPWLLVLRSSTAANTPLRLANAVGVIDAGYRGEVIAIVDNLSEASVALHPGHAYFQMVLGDNTPLEPPYVKIVLARDLPETKRGSGGLGSTDE